MSLATAEGSLRQIAGRNGPRTARKHSASLISLRRHVSIICTGCTFRTSKRSTEVVLIGSVPGKSLIETRSVVDSSLRQAVRAAHCRKSRSNAGFERCYDRSVCQGHGELPS